jgi:hypothetical protein
MEVSFDEAVQRDQRNDKDGKLNKQLAFNPGNVLADGSYTVGKVNSTLDKAASKFESLKAKARSADLQKPE